MNCEQLWREQNKNKQNQTKTLNVYGLQLETRVLQGNWWT